MACNPSNVDCTITSRRRVLYKAYLLLTLSSFTQSFSAVAEERDCTAASALHACDIGVGGNVDACAREFRNCARQTPASQVAAELAKLTAAKNSNLTNESHFVCDANSPGHEKSQTVFIPGMSEGIEVSRRGATCTVANASLNQLNQPDRTCHRIWYQFGRLLCETGAIIRPLELQSGLQNSTVVCHEVGLRNGFLVCVFGSDAMILDPLSFRPIDAQAAERMRAANARLAEQIREFESRRAAPPIERVPPAAPNRDPYENVRRSGNAAYQDCVRRRGAGNCDREMQDNPYDRCVRAYGESRCQSRARDNECVKCLRAFSAQQCMSRCR